MGLQLMKILSTSNGREFCSYKYKVIISRDWNYLLTFLYKICIPVCTYQTIIVLYLYLICVSTNNHSLSLEVFDDIRFCFLFTFLIILQ